MCLFLVSPVVSPPHICAQWPLAHMTLVNSLAPGLLPLKHLLFLFMVGDLWHSNQSHRRNALRAPVFGLTIRWTITYEMLLLSDKTTLYYNVFKVMVDSEGRGNLKMSRSKPAQLPHFLTPCLPAFPADITAVSVFILKADRRTGWEMVPTMADPDWVFVQLGSHLSSSPFSSSLSSLELSSHPEAKTELQPTVLSVSRVGVLV